MASMPEATKGAARSGRARVEIISTPIVSGLSLVDEEVDRHGGKANSGANAMNTDTREAFGHATPPAADTLS